MLLDKVLQPSIFSLFSSTSSHPTLLASCKTCPSTPSDSFISLLDDATDAHETLIAFSGSPSSLSSRTDSLASQRRNQDEQAGGVVLKHLASRVLHLQAPDCRTTSIRWGSTEDRLGVTLPLLHIQVKDLGQTFFFDVAVLDDQGEVTVIRCSTWQPHPKLHPATPTHPRLLHLPLLFPSTTSSTTPLLTRWTTLTLPLPALLASLPSAPRFKAVLSVEVHATCRLRRIWFTEDEHGVREDVDEEMARRGVRPEMALFAAD
ncbi:hypothetical protein JCM10207_003418 [Rhodosporidiobolus poonsookiae]